MSVALIVIDVQNDFCPGGALAVPRGDAVVGPINRLIGRHERVILTQDWHPAGHRSFASSRPGRSPFEVVEGQVLWPDHCIQGTPGAAFHADLHTDAAQWVVRKGTDPAVDSYSGFFDNAAGRRTGLAGVLRALGVSRVRLTGLATDFCVAYTARDARRLGFDVDIVLDAVAGIDAAGVDAALADLHERGCRLLTSGLLP